MYGKRHRLSVAESAIIANHVILSYSLPWSARAATTREGSGLLSIIQFSLGPRPFFGEEKRPGAISSRMREKFRKITVKSLVYVEMNYTAKVFGTRLLFHVYTRVHG